MRERAPYFLGATPSTSRVFQTFNTSQQPRNSRSPAPFIVPLKRNSSISEKRPTGDYCLIIRKRRQPYPLSTSLGNHPPPPPWYLWGIPSNLRRPGEVTQGHLKVGPKSKRKTKTQHAFSSMTDRILESFILERKIFPPTHFLKSDWFLLFSLSYSTPYLFRWLTASNSDCHFLNMQRVDFSYFQRMNFINH